MTENFEIGQLYRAISETELVEVSAPTPVAGLKLLVNPDAVKTLRTIQRKLRDSLGEKPSFPAVLNAMIAIPNWDAHIDAIAAIIAEHKSRSNQDEQ